MRRQLNNKEVEKSRPLTDAKSNTVNFPVGLTFIPDILSMK